MPAIIIPGAQPKYKCRVCNHPFRDGEERAFARHTRQCAEEYHLTKVVERSRLDFMKPWDPEYAEWAKTAWRQGKLRPSTEAP